MLQKGIWKSIAWILLIVFTCDTYCRVCKGPVPTCDDCDAGYFYSFKTDQCEKCGPNCLKCFVTQSNTSCDSGMCAIGYAAKSESDGECIPNCLSCSTGSNNRTLCKNDSSLNSLFSSPACANRVGCDPWCIQCYRRPTTRFCAPGWCVPGTAFSTKTQQCEWCSPHCQKCDINQPPNCDPGQCYYGYTLDKETLQCVPCGPNCFKCDINRPPNCDPGQCDKAYTHDSNTLACVPCGKNCKKCDINKSPNCDPGKCHYRYAFDNNTLACVPIQNDYYST